MRGWKTFLTLLAVVMAATGAARAEPLLIRNSYVVPVSNWEPMIVEKKDLAKHWGKSYVMEAVRYQGTPTMITAPICGIFTSSSNSPARSASMSCISARSSSVAIAI